MGATPASEWRRPEESLEKLVHVLCYAKQKSRTSFYFCFIGFISKHALQGGHGASHRQGADRLQACNQVSPHHPQYDVLKPK